VPKEQKSQLNENEHPLALLSDQFTREERKIGLARNKRGSSLLHFQILNESLVNEEAEEHAEEP
jgi:hypothetical protein